MIYVSIFTTKHPWVTSIEILFSFHAFSQRHSKENLAWKKKVYPEFELNRFWACLDDMFKLVCSLLDALANPLFRFRFDQNFNIFGRNLGGFEWPVQVRLINQILLLKRWNEMPKIRSFSCHNWTRSSLCRDQLVTVWTMLKICFFYCLCLLLSQAVTLTASYNGFHYFSLFGQTN